MGGFFGIVSKKPCVNELYYGTDYHSHLGTRRGGMAAYDGDAHQFVRSIHNLENAYFRNKFEGDLDKFATATSGIGVISDTDPQPILFNSRLGKFAIVTVAKICNLDAIEQRMLEHNQHFNEVSMGRTNQTEAVALLITEGHDWVSGIEHVQESIEGSCSMLLLTPDGIIAARDRWGRTPLVLGRRDDAWAAVSETTSLANLDFEIAHYLGPGEIVKITAQGMTQLKAPQQGMQVCSFLWIYYGFPTSSYEGRNVEQVRYALGLKAGVADDCQVDCACGIPDSGTGMAVGYAQGHKVPFMRAVSKYTPTWPRSFMPSNQSQRSLVAKMKLIPNRDILKGRRCLFCDDSIVRGTQLRDNTRVLFDCGAREVHMRISCPPLIYGCRFINFTNSKSDLELITRRVIGELEGDPSKHLDRYATAGTPQYNAMVQAITRRFGLTSLKFTTVDDLVQAIGLPKCQLCTHCFDGSSHF